MTVTTSVTCRWFKRQPPQFITDRQLKLAKPTTIGQSAEFNLAAGEINLDDADKSKSTGYFYTQAKLIVDPQGQLKFDLVAYPWKLQDIADWKGGPRSTKSARTCRRPLGCGLPGHFWSGGESPVKILIIGAGVQGTVFAVRLANAGHQVILVSRPDRARDLSQQGAPFRMQIIWKSAPGCSLFWIGCRPILLHTCAW